MFLIVLIRNLLFVPARGHFILGREKRERTISNQIARSHGSRVRAEELCPQNQVSARVQLSLHAT